MSALIYTIPTLLEGKSYRSRSRKIEGIIQEATPAENVFYENAEAFRIRVRPTYEIGKLFREDFYAIVAVRVGE
jgi:hypothetical protein